MNVWRFPQDILYSVYGEWLGWKDLSRLDIACIEKNHRELWLTSLRDIKMTRKLISRLLLSDEKMRIFYAWLSRCKILFVDGFPMRMSVLADLVQAVDLTSFCPALRSVDMERWESPPIIDRDYFSQLETNLFLFLSHCHSLRGVTVWLSDPYSNEAVYILSDIILRVLVESTRESSLIKIDLMGSCSYDQYNALVPRLLTKHASSLQELYLYSMKINMDLISSILIENNTRLRVLSVNEKAQQPNDSWLLPFLSSCGDLLETLNIEYTNSASSKLHHVFALVAGSCPRLVCLKVQGGVCSVENLSLLYEQCPHLQHVSIPDTITLDDKSSSVTIFVKEQKTEWLQYLSYALTRKQSKNVILSLKGLHFRPEIGGLKSMLEPYRIHVEANSSEASLIALLKDLPHLESLKLRELNGYEYTDATLTAITQYRSSLKELHMERTVEHTFRFRFSDKVMSEMIEACQLLTGLIIIIYGTKSLMAVSQHSHLRKVYFYVAQSVSKEMLERLLLDKKVNWPSTLQKGVAFSSSSCGRYEFNNNARCWSKW
eukprot:scaffold440_cov277-Ochromonas_danica.AAC.25